MYHFKNKTALVTGSGQGIGKAIAQAFSHHEANVVLTDQDEEAGREALQWLLEKGAPAESLHFVPCNVADEGEVKRLIRESVDRFGRLDFLVNNAGLSNFTPFEELTVAGWDEVLGVNLRGAFLCSKFAAPHLKESGSGAILNITSTRAHQSEKQSEAYAASKGGLLSLTHALAISLGPQVRVNAISPGWIEVGHWKKKSQRKEIHHSAQEREQHPAGRVGEPEDIGRAAVFLCSGEAGFITGQELIIDGGMSKRMIYEA
ncbi:SDR family NAD(P)-dependent oxidoreductase [Cesiribacter andamanensis]|uniref:Glucose 1-dehydrogenase 2 n=1 Tax=Cesiribacter andamanensis AMV16 TaxID=1279009 RepID=M7N7E6_9BACT|nr:glucose 1-dehydrogenase [Cesiribacter andamanensis]EMR03182.1 Glucose 1-dehydrogenase 2 [Cesiribacter andamanensis AMV16]